MNETSVPASAAPLDLSGLVEAILANGLAGLPLAEQLSDFCIRLSAAGFPMKRASMGMATLHPRYGALTFVWRPDNNSVEATPQDRTVLESETFRLSPVAHLMQSGEPTYRVRLDGKESLPFELLEKLRTEGLTDYGATIVRFNPDMESSILEGMFLSCATDLADGFDDAHMKQVLDLLPTLALALKSRLTYEVARTVSETYLGHDAGRRVLTGEILRGSARSIDAVIWLCDLRGFTALADQMDREDLIAILDEYFDVLADPVDTHGGQILKFMGDGFLATFELADRDRSAVASEVLDAAAALRTGMAAFNSDRRDAGKPVLDFGLALHIGEVSYGNIGTDQRLDFTIVGPAVNLASRLEGLCRPLGRDILVSGALRDAAINDRDRLEALGQHNLRGVGRPQGVFGLKP